MKRPAVAAVDAPPAQRARGKDGRRRTAAVPRWTCTARDLLALRSTEAIRAAQQDLDAFALTPYRL